MSRPVVGIDPGKDGAVVVVHDDGVEGWRAKSRYVMRGEYLPHEMAALMLEIMEAHPGVTVCLEEQHSQGGQGHVGPFSTGRGWGMWEGVLGTLGRLYGLSWRSVRPQTWQQGIGVPKPPRKKKGKPKPKARDPKGLVVAIVQRELPDLDLIPAGCSVIQTGLSDAAGIALYGRRG